MGNISLAIDVAIKGAPAVQQAATAVKALHGEVTALGKALAKLDAKKLASLGAGAGGGGKGKGGGAPSVGAPAATGGGGGVLGFLRGLFGRDAPRAGAPADAAQPKKSKTPKEPKEPKEPKAPKDKKQPKEPKEPNAPKDKKPPREKGESKPDAPKAPGAPKKAGGPEIGSLLGAAGAMKGLRAGALGAITVMGGVSVAAVSALKDVRAFGVQSALYFQGLGEYSAQTLRLEQNLKNLFRGTDTAPLIRSAQRMADLFDRNRQFGSILSRVLTEGLGSSLKLIERLVPLAEDFAVGFLIAFLDVSAGAKNMGAAVLQGFTAVIKAGGPVSETIVKIYKAIGGGEAAITAGKVAFYGVAVSLAAVGVALALPLVAVGLLVAAGYGLAIALGWIVTKATDAVDAVKAFLGIGDATKAVDTLSGTIRGLADSLPGASKAAAGGAKSAGASIGDGLVSGMLAKLGEITAAGAKMASAADQGVRKEAQVASPAKKFITNGRYMGLGVIGGIEATGPAVQAAAAANLVPSLPGLDGAGAGGAGVETKSASAAAGSAPGAINVVFNGPVTLGGDPAGLEGLAAARKLFTVAISAAIRTR